jgi:hypothetical protein
MAGSRLRMGPKQREQPDMPMKVISALPKVELPRSATAKQTIGRIASLAGLGQERLNSAVSGRSNPVSRMAAARLATARLDHEDGDGRVDAHPGGGRRQRAPLFPRC